MCLGRARRPVRGRGSEAAPVPVRPLVPDGTVLLGFLLIVEAFRYRVLPLPAEAANGSGAGVRRVASARPTNG